MKIKSLLAAVSMVAITAGSANALIITNTTPGGPIVPALELNTPLSPGVNLGTFSLEVAPNTNAQFPGGTNLVVNVTLPSGVTFATDVEGDDISGEAESAVVQGGSGAAGSNTVQFLADMVDTTTTDAPMIFNFDLALSDCPTGTATVTVATENGTPIEQGTISLGATDALIGACAPALSAMVMSDEATSDTFITLASDFTALSGDVAAGAAGAIDGTLGTIQLKVDTDVSVDLLTGDPMDEGDIDTVTFDVCFEDATGIDTVRVGSTFGVKDGNTFSFTVTADAAIATLIVAPNRIIATTNGVDAVVSQTPSVKNVLATFDDTDAPLVADSDDLRLAGLTGGNLDVLQREGILFGFFDWNAGPAIAAPTFSVYRVTGLEPDTDYGYSLIVENSNDDGIYPGTFTTTSEGEHQFVSTTMPVPATMGRFDVAINLETSENCVDIDRILFRGGIVSDFGGGANRDQTDGIEPDSLNRFGTGSNADSDNGFPVLSVGTPSCEN